MRPTIRFGRIAGIEVGVHWSLLVIGVLLVGSLAGGVLPATAPDAHGSYLAAAVLAVVFFFGSILAHELAHSIVAVRRGQKVNGITLWLLGGVSELGTEAKNARDELHVAIAGPATSFALAIVFGGSRSRSTRSRRARCCRPSRGGSRWSTSSSPSSTCCPARRSTADACSRRGSGSATATAAARRSPRHAPAGVVGTLLIVGFHRARVLGLRLHLHRPRRLVRAQRLLARGEHGPPVPHARRPRRRRADASHRPLRPRLDDRRRLRARRRADPPPRVGWHTERPATSQRGVRRPTRGTGARATPRARVCRSRPSRGWPSERRRATRSPAGFPALVVDADDRPVGLLSVDELKIAARSDPVLARSAR